MRTVLFAAALSLVAGLFGTPLYIRFLVRRSYGQFIRDDGPTSHHTKRGTPTMGGVVIIGSALFAYAGAHLLTLRPPSASGLLVLFLMTGLGFVGFLDDFIKISKQRSLGLRAGAKLAGQSVVAIAFAILATQFKSSANLTPASYKISFIRDTGINLAFAGPAIGVILFVIWAYIMIAATSNGVNLTDGLDGLATGASVMTFASYVLIGIWQSNQSCQLVTEAAAGGKCYDVRDPRDLAVVAACVMGACFGFLWWNASPAKIFMGDTGSLALGGMLGAIAVATKHEVVLAIVGGLFVLEAVSVIIQVASFNLTGKHVFKMAPIHHHFEQLGWTEPQVVIRFWIIAVVLALIGLSSLKLR